jgi:L-arabinokinase
MVIALQPRTDRTLRIRTMQANQQGLPVETRIPLEYFEIGNTFVSYEHARNLFKANPLSSWAAYIGGSIFTLLKEQCVHLPFGFNLFLLSGVPMNVGIGSSAATEIATLHCLQNYLMVNIPENNLAQLGQIAENLVVGAPCGIMDQISVTSGQQDKLTHILCRPGSIIGEVEVPPGTAFVGINSMVKHSVGGAAYGDVRIGAFIGKRIINQHRASQGEKPLSYLTELSVEEFEEKYHAVLPETIRGSDFLKTYQSHHDDITRIQPDATYRVEGPAMHPVYENHRVLKFINHLSSISNNHLDEKQKKEELIEAGRCMYGSHESYRNNCLLSVPEVDLSLMRCGPGG